MCIRGEAMSVETFSEQIKQWGRDEGFDRVGIAPALPIEHADVLRRWIEQGRQGPITYLARNVEKRIDPAQLMPGAKSILCAAMSYYTGDDSGSRIKADGKTVRVARYTWGRDYHDGMRERLFRWAEKIQSRLSSPMRYRCFVDTAPLAEKAHAARAGLGWIGKNTLLINPDYGSWLVLGEILCDLELSPDSPLPDGCGDCQKCLNACPAGALTGPRELDARKCNSCWTVEYKGEIPNEAAKTLHGWIFGCDDCQLVCPYNQTALEANHPEFQPRIDGERLSAEKVGEMTEDEFTQRFSGTSLLRAGRKHLLQMLLLAEREG